MPWRDGLEGGLRWPVPFSGPRHRWRVRWLARWVLRLAQGGPVLDIGCGYGALAGELAARGHQILAMDIDLRRLRHQQRAAHACRLEGRLAIFAADGTAMPLPDNCLSLAVAGEVLEHIANDGAFVREVARILRPGGRLVATVPAGAHRCGTFDRYAGHLRRYDRQQLWDLAAANGLEVETLRGWGFPLGRLYERLVQRPALMARQPSFVGRLAGRLARSRLASGLEWLFGLESRLPAGTAGCGWLLVARKPAQS